MPAFTGLHPVSGLFIAENRMPCFQLLHERHQAAKPQGGQTNAPVLKTYAHAQNPSPCLIARYPAAGCL
jgi:hypothetical protein